MAISLQTSSNVTPGQNKCLLNLWPDILMESRWHFNQAAGIGAPLQTSHDQAGVVYQQKEREYIARHLEMAADRMADDLNYHIRPMYFTESIPLGTGVPYFNQILQARWLKMIALGTKATALIQADVTVTFSDPNNTGVNDTATITLTTDLAADEIKVFFRVADGAASGGDYRYEIEPLQVSKSGNTVTITGHRSLFVQPSEWLREYQAFDPNFNSPNIVDTATTSGFVSQVDVYRVYTDTSAPISLYNANGEVIRTYTGEIVNLELSAFRLGNPCCADLCSGLPVYISVSYLAGSPLVFGYPDNELYEAVVAYACSRMPARLTGMSYWSLENFTRWNNPMVRTVSGTPIPIATDRQSKSGYGALEGAVLAWDTMLERRIEKGHKLTIGSFNRGWHGGW